ncbi:DPP IV N-terminal domain-containing protein [Laceyella putida]|uniref:DPP IV N-terminal domain-containing protein n=1 Tax=Laceyella putida TaxID=110101 RepID=A0ABW2RL27_9BACL
MKKTLGIVSAVLVTTSLLVPAHADQANKSIYFNGGSLYSQAIYRFNPDTMDMQKVSPGTNADLSPDGSKLAFIKNDSLYISDANGRNQVRLTNSHFPTFDSSPRWSPDGKKIVFAKSDGNLYLIEVASKKVKALTQVNEGVHHAEPDWSPDGSKIVFHSSDQSGFTHIYSMNTDGSNVKKLTGLGKGNCSEYSPHYSPDGSKILYGVTKQGETDAYVMNADGSQPKNITTGTTKAVASAIWSEDGEKILYTVNDKELNQDSHFYITNADGSDNKIMKISVPFATPSAWQTAKEDASQDGAASTFKKITNFFLD